MLRVYQFFAVVLLVVGGYCQAQVFFDDEPTQPERSRPPFQQGGFRNQNGFGQQQQQGFFNGNRNPNNNGFGGNPNNNGQGFGQNFQNPQQGFGNPNNNQGFGNQNFSPNPNQNPNQNQGFGNQNSNQNPNQNQFQQLQATTQQPFSRQPDCRTFQNQGGLCTPLASCERIGRMIRNRSTVMAARILSRSICGFEGILPSVCCPIPRGQVGDNFLGGGDNSNFGNGSGFETGNGFGNGNNFGNGGSNGNNPNGNGSGSGNGFGGGNPNGNGFGNGGSNGGNNPNGNGSGFGNGGSNGNGFGSGNGFGNGGNPNGNGFLNPNGHGNNFGNPNGNGNNFGNPNGNTNDFGNPNGNGFGNGKPNGNTNNFGNPNGNGNNFGNPNGNGNNFGNPNGNGNNFGNPNRNDNTGNPNTITIPITPNPTTPLPLTSTTSFGSGGPVTLIPPKTLPPSTGGGGIIIIGGGPNPPARGGESPGLSAEGLPEDCGFSNASHTRIVGGRSAEKGGWPWIAALGYKDESGNVNYLCGGALISPNFVVTASHCVYKRNDLFSVRLGDHDIFTDSDGVSPLNIEIAQIIQHPKYDPATFYNDIAMIKLKQSVPFTRQVHPICLPSSKSLRNERFENNTPFVAGWGAIQFNGPSSSVLQEVQIPVVPDSVCQEKFKSFKSVNVDDTNICAGLQAGGKDACQGDSGALACYSNGLIYLMANSQSQMLYKAM